ncbi:MAG: energy-coupling factor ABC transporter substrate-binding protein [Archaeoglobi archaeon]|nr:MAG: energy-coupling factor ABC transporter substrate-binding protein [Archaeoglobi archaeon]TDA27920.1 MAG: energy-coupling factor ABC transporter substrate-binding protein [Archaeoglobi archaeon]TDA30464.1 MAG: energy-coupling factor ABC transporter substrate-binding protein [Archaeoglobi archaeon]
MRPNKILLLVLPVALIALSGAQEWKGTDDIAEGAIAELSPDYKPWFSPIFEPTGELEGLFFSVQAAIGGFLIGYFLGKHDRES